MGTVALCLAAGRGARLGHARPKGFVHLAGRPLVLHALEALAASEAVDALLPVVPEAEMEAFREAVSGFAGAAELLEPVAGGAERQDSVRCGVDALPATARWVAVHDAARALVDPQDVTRVVCAARASGAAILATPVRDTIKRVAAGRIVETPDRAECWAAQTPQVFRVELLREALAKAAAEGFLGSDDAQLVERLGAAVEIVEGSPDNWKLTHPQDLATAERILEERR